MSCQFACSQAFRTDGGSYTNAHGSPHGAPESYSKSFAKTTPLASTSLPTSRTSTRPKSFHLHFPLALPANDEHLPFAFSPTSDDKHLPLPLPPTPTFPLHFSPLPPLPPLPPLHRPHRPPPHQRLPPPLPLLPHHLPRLHPPIPALPNLSLIPLPPRPRKFLTAPYLPPQRLQRNSRRSFEGEGGIYRARLLLWVACGGG